MSYEQWMMLVGLIMTLIALVRLFKDGKHAEAMAIMGLFGIIAFKS